MIKQLKFKVKMKGLSRFLQIVRTYFISSLYRALSFFPLGDPLAFAWPNLKKTSIIISVSKTVYCFSKLHTRHKFLKTFYSAYKKWHHIRIAYHSNKMSGFFGQTFLNLVPMKKGDKSAQD